MQSVMHFSINGSLTSVCFFVTFESLSECMYVIIRVHIYLHKHFHLDGVMVAIFEGFALEI